MTTNLGLLSVWNKFGVVRVRRALPSEHVIEAERPASFEGGVDLLIRGPLLPECVDPANPAPVAIILTMHEVAPGHGVRLTGVFRARANPDSAEWTIGQWPSLDAYRAEFGPP